MTHESVLRYVFVPAFFTFYALLEKYINLYNFLFVFFHKVKQLHCFSLTSHELVFSLVLCTVWYDIGIAIELYIYLQSIMDGEHHFTRFGAIYSWYMLDDVLWCLLCTFFMFIPFELYVFM